MDNPEAKVPTLEPVWQSEAFRPVQGAPWDSLFFSSTQNAFRIAKNLKPENGFELWAVRGVNFSTPL